MARRCNPNKGLPTTARIHPRVLDAIGRLAKDHDRTPSAEIDAACEAWARTHGKLSGPVDREAPRAAAS